MLDKGILYDEARREFEKMFITRALQRSKGSVGDAADAARPAPQHRGAEDGGVSDQAELTPAGRFSFALPASRRARLALSPARLLDNLPPAHND